MFSLYNLLELQDYRSLPSRYRYFYLELSKMVYLIKATLAGMLAGFVTGILHTVFEIPSILAGSLTQISLWSINLWIMGGSSNIPLLQRHEASGKRGNPARGQAAARRNAGGSAQGEDRRHV